MNRVRIHLFTLEGSDNETDASSLASVRRGVPTILAYTDLERTKASKTRCRQGSMDPNHHAQGRPFDLNRSPTKYGSPAMVS